MDPIDVTTNPPSLSSAARLAAAMGRRDEAAELMQRSLEAQFDPRLAFDLGNLLFDSHRFREASEWLRKCVAALPDSTPAHGNLAKALLRAGDPAEAHAVAKAEHARTGDREMLSIALLSINYLPELGDEEVYRQHLVYREGLPIDRGAASLPNGRDPERPLRLGFVSADLRNHPVGFLLDALFPALSREGWEIHVLNNGVGGDALTTRLHRHCRTWHDITRKGDGEVQALCGTLGLDIALDMSGHSGGHRLLAFARRIAPIQATWYGYANTSGVPAMDYFIADPRQLPHGSERYILEQPLRLPDSYICHAPPARLETSRIADASSGVVFGSFNNIAKLTDEVLRTWSRIIAAVPDSRILVRSIMLRDAASLSRLRSRLVAAGMLAERIDLGFCPDAESTLESYRHVDVALDPWPYSGCTTTLDSLWMGVPVVAMEGRGVAGRHAWGHLHSAGLGQWVSRTADDYIEVAVAAANRRDQLRAERTEIRERLSRSTLLDAGRFVDQFQRALRTAWRRWCDGEPPSPIEQ